MTELKVVDPKKLILRGEEVEKGQTNKKHPHVRKTIQEENEVGARREEKKLGTEVETKGIKEITEKRAIPGGTIEADHVIGVKMLFEVHRKINFIFKLRPFWQVIECR